MIGIILCFDSRISKHCSQYRSDFQHQGSFSVLEQHLFFCIQKKKLMSIKLVHIKHVYELLSSWTRDQTHITSPSCTGRQIFYLSTVPPRNRHTFQDHCHQLLLFMTKVGETTLEEVLIRVLIGSTHKSRNCYTGYSRCYWDKSVPPMMMGITEKLLQMHGMRCLHDKCVPLILLLQGCLLQHEGMHFKDARYSSSSNR